MAVAVDDQRGAGCGCRAGAVAVEIKVARRAVDLEGCSRFRCCSIHSVVIHLVPASRADDLVGRMRQNVDERMSNGSKTELGQSCRAQAGALVKRREHDVEAFELAIGEIQPPVSQDVDLHPVKDGQLRVPDSESFDFMALPRDLIRAQGMRRAGMLGVIGDGDVLVS